MCPVPLFTLAQLDLLDPDLLLPLFLQSFLLPSQLPNP